MWLLLNPHTFFNELMSANIAESFEQVNPRAVVLKRELKIPLLEK